MLFSWLMLMVVVMFFYLWGDFMKILILLELTSLFFIMAVMMALKLDYLSLNFFLFCLISLVCESSMGFLSSIIYISMESELVKKLNLIQFQ